MKRHLFLGGLLVLALGVEKPTWCPPSNKPASHARETHDDAYKDEGHDGHGGHEDEYTGPNVGTDKGILAASVEKGIKLAPIAEKNFGLKTLRLEGKGPWLVPEAARFRFEEEQNVYRVRDEFFKRVPFVEVRRSPQGFAIRSSELKAGDAVVISGVGFLRIAELAAFDENEMGHWH